MWGCFIVDSYQNDDPNKQLISWDQFHDEIENYTSLIGKSKDANESIALMKEHAKCAKEANKKFKKNEYLNVSNGQPILKKAKTPPLNKRLMTLSEMVHKKIPLTDIITVLTDLEKWLHLSRHLKPLSGYEAKIDDYDLRFIATCFAYGCNIGPVQAERCLKIFSRKQIAWLFNHHITEYRLNKISECIIQAYKKFELPFIWGDGKAHQLMVLIGICTLIIYYQSIIFATVATEALATTMSLINILPYLETLSLVVFMRPFIFLMQSII